MGYNVTARQGMELSPRELQCLTLKSTGLGNKEVANHLGIKLQTVKNHLSDSYRKLGVTNIIEALIALGWVTPPRIPE